MNNPSIFEHFKSYKFHQCRTSSHRKTKFSFSQVHSYQTSELYSFFLMFISEQWFIIDSQFWIISEYSSNTGSRDFDRSSRFEWIPLFEWFSDDLVHLIEPVSLTTLHHRSSVRRLTEKVLVGSLPLKVEDFESHDYQSIEFRRKYPELKDDLFKKENLVRNV